MVGSGIVMITFVYVEYAADRAGVTKELDKRSRDSGEGVAANALSCYNYDGLATASAESWLAHEKEKAAASGDQKQVDCINKWAVRTADLDNNPDIPDKVILFSNTLRKKN
jgi:hypothetical protein